ncbi:MAG TPA: acetyl-coenzyme A synthetase N-terminal domain-containing protein, partial [Arthrobacter sp.]|nr:acetyl-coenzyme A synthetase N-terminal domain-containing protein [Arthrobacter sp.]
MIVDAQAADGEVIWRPGSSAGADTEIERFAGFLRAQGLEIGQEYDEIWQWSVDSPETFWELFAQFAGVEFGGSQGPVCTPDVMPHTRWFPGRTLNFARHLLEGHNGTALIAVAEDGSREEVSWDALRREVASLAKHLRDLGVSPG